MRRGRAAQGPLEVTRGERESNCLVALKVLEMICDLFRVCKRRGGGRGGEAVERNGQRKMAISCQRGVKCVCQGSGGWSNAEIIVSEPHERGGSGSGRWEGWGRGGAPRPNTHLDQVGRKEWHSSERESDRKREIK